ncbi:MAG TPA: hypothetical protein VHA06_22325 [Candidatus Angelobacter sp.]|jgi:hypothetical protein|nr:hypothetical protein [Candidatus Angelobacter sp.]
MEKPLLAFILLLLYALPFGMAEQATAVENQQRHRYRNEDYGYVVRIPFGIKIETAPPPSPNHGFRIQLTPSTLLWVDASYTDDSSLPQILASERQILGKGCRLLTNKPTRLERQPASRMIFKCTSKKNSEASTIITEVEALRPDSGIKYKIALQTITTEKPPSNAAKIFNEMLAGFSLIPIK